MISLPRRADPPAALANGGARAYADVSVREALEEDLHGKCYLCERSRPGLEIEHLRPQVHFHELRNEWNNLFLACNASCNQRRIRWEARAEAELRDGRPIRWPIGGMLNPSTDDIERRIIQHHELVGSDVLVTFSARDPEDLAAVNTAIELQFIHDDGRGGRILREDIRAAKCHFLESYAGFRSLDRRAQAPERAQALKRVRHLLGPRAPFAGLLRAWTRGTLAGRPDLLEELGLA